MGEFFKKAFADMKESARAQREVDKANFEAVKDERKANFEENRGHNTLESSVRRGINTMDIEDIAVLVLGVVVVFALIASLYLALA